MRVAEIRELQGKDTFAVKNSGLYPAVGVESRDVSAVGLDGGGTQEGWQSRWVMEAGVG